MAGQDSSVEPQEEAAVDPQAPDIATDPPAEAAHASSRLQKLKESLLTLVRPSDYHVSDDEVFVILIDGDEGATTAELRETKSITVPMYLVWKKKYKNLHFDELKKARRQELRRRYTIVAAVLAVAVLGAGGIVFALTRSMNPTATVAAKTTPAPKAQPTPNAQPTPVQKTEPPPAPKAEPPKVQQRPAPPKAEPAAAVPATVVPADTEPGYKIQVAAATSLKEGQAAVARLTSAGYPAYVTQVVVGSREVFRVRVGPFDTRSAAEEMVARLKTAGYNGAWIAR